MHHAREAIGKASQVRPCAQEGIVAGLLLCLLGCLVGVREPVHDVEGGPGEEVYSTEPAPPPQAEVSVGVAPGPEYVWVGGYWTRHRDNWFWVRGRWASRPHANAVWVGGRWESHPRGYVWRGGHWK
jgi:hypothetical protein